MFPVDGVTRPLRILKIVDLPAPDGPITAVKEPPPMFRFTESSNFFLPIVSETSLTEISAPELVS